MEDRKNADSPHKLAELKPTMKLKGRVTKIELFGAFVDIGAECDGMVHISMLRRGRVNRVDDIVHEGQEVDVWVHHVDPNAGRLELTMVKPVELKWKSIKPGMKLKGEVVRLEKFGAFVDVGAERPGLIHVSELSTEYISDPSEVVKLGEEVQVSVIDVDRKKRQLRLSIKDFSSEIEIESEDKEEVPTAMEIALREALQTNERAEHTTSTGTPSRQVQGRRELDDILSRTLKQRMPTSSSNE